MNQTTPRHSRILNPLVLGCASLVLCATQPSTAAEPQAAASAPAPAKPAVTADPGLLNTWLREHSPDFTPWDLGGQARARFELFENASPAFPNLDFQRNGAKNDNDFLLLRARLHAGYSTPWVRAYAEGQTADSIGDLDPKRPGRDTMDLHQAYAAIGNLKEFPLELKVGRQEFIYGDERLIGASDWGNPARAFDAARLRFDNGKFWVDAFSGRVVLTDDSKFDQPDFHDWFSGLYASTKALIPIQESQLYVLSRNSEKGAAVTPRDIISVGLRVKSLPGKLDGWDYFGEVVEQFGSVSQTNVRRDQEALAAAIGGGYTWTQTFASPRVGVEYDYSSGDANPTDGKSQTLDNLFPTNHKHYGLMDLVGWRNIHDVRLSLSTKPRKGLTVGLDYHLFWLADTHDSFYPQAGAGRNASGYGRNSTYSNFVGSELDLDANYAVTTWLGVRAGYGHFFTGDYIDASKASRGGATDADWVYTQLTINF